jgi:hypothetical protein
LNLNPGNFGGSTILSVSCGETCLHVSLCVDVSCGMAVSDKNQDRCRRLGAEDRGWSSTYQVLGGRTIERSGDSVCGLYRTQGDEECGFLGSASKPRPLVSPGLASKLVATVLVVLPQNHSLGFLGMGLKIGSYGLVIWPTKSLRWFLGLGLKTK